MRSTMRNIFALVFILLFSLGCAKQALLEVHQPITTQTFKIDDIKEAIEHAAKQRGWSIVVSSPNLYRLYYYSPRYEISVDVNYTLDGYIIKYYDSKYLHYSDNSIDRRYNHQIKLLHKSIREKLKSKKRLESMKLGDTAMIKTADKSVSKLELEDELRQLKKFYNEGLIDATEYRAKKAKLLQID